MEVSSLPPFPVPEPPLTATPPAPVGRGKRMLLQALFLLAFWPAVYVIHERATHIAAAEQKTREQEEVERDRRADIERIMGRWVGNHGDAWIISFQPDVFVLRLDAKAVVLGSWRLENGIYPFLARDLVGDWRGRIVGDELLVEQSASREGTWRVVFRLRRPGKE